MSNINYSKLPEHLQGGMRRYIENRIPPGSFLQAVLSNDLMGAMSRGDDDSLGGLVNICRFLYNEAPHNCHGSPEGYANWLAFSGADGSVTYEIVMQP